MKYKPGSIIMSISCCIELAIFCACKEYKSIAQADIYPRVECLPDKLGQGQGVKALNLRGEECGEIGSKLVAVRPKKIKSMFPVVHPKTMCDVFFYL